MKLILKDCYIPSLKTLKCVRRKKGNDYMIEPARGFSKESRKHKIENECDYCKL